MGLKENLWEEDSLSTRDKWSVPNVSSVRRFYCTKDKCHWRSKVGKGYRSRDGRAIHTNLWPLLTCILHSVNLGLFSCSENWSPELLEDGKGHSLFRMKHSLDCEPLLLSTQVDVDIIHVVNPFKPFWLHHTVHCTEKIVSVHLCVGYAHGSY